MHYVLGVMMLMMMMIVVVVKRSERWKARDVKSHLETGNVLPAGSLLLLELILLIATSLPLPLSCCSPNESLRLLRSLLLSAPSVKDLTSVPRETMSFFPAALPRLAPFPPRVEETSRSPAAAAADGVIFNAAVANAEGPVGCSPFSSTADGFVGVNDPVVVRLVLEAVVVDVAGEGLFLTLARPHPFGETMPAFLPGAGRRSLCLLKTLAWIASTSSTPGTMASGCEVGANVA